MSGLGSSQNTFNQFHCTGYRGTPGMIIMLSRMHDERLLRCRTLYSSSAVLVCAFVCCLHIKIPPFENMYSCTRARTSTRIYHACMTCDRQKQNDEVPVYVYPVAASKLLGISVWTLQNFHRFFVKIASCFWR